MNGHHQLLPQDRSAQEPIEFDSRLLLASCWRILEQSPPPSLQEVLRTYRNHGDGDREMLLALLNAKSAEDQRIASAAALHRAMLDFQPHLNSLDQTHESDYPSTDGCNPYRLREAGFPAHSPPDVLPSNVSLPPLRSVPSPHARTESPRKRHRSSAAFHSQEPQPLSQKSEESPASPISSHHSESPEYSPRSRTSITIGSLLSHSDDHMQASAENHSNPGTEHRS